MHGGILDNNAYYDNQNKIRELNKELEKLKPICPKCKISLVKRKGNFGQFWGCQNYPQCKYTKKIDPSLEQEREHLHQQLSKIKEK